MTTTTKVHAFCSTVTLTSRYSETSNSIVTPYYSHTPTKCYPKLRRSLIQTARNCDDTARRKKELDRQRNRTSNTNLSVQHYSVTASRISVCVFQAKQTNCRAMCTSYKTNKQSQRAPQRSI